MSRNLGRTNCDRCDGRVSLDEAPRGILPGEAGIYYKEYSSRRFANATCTVCGALYLGWIGDPWTGKGDFLSDLSFRSTFNDEPHEDDLPIWTPEYPGSKKAIEKLEALSNYWWLCAKDLPEGVESTSCRIFVQRFAQMAKDVRQLHSEGKALSANLSHLNRARQKLRDEKAAAKDSATQKTTDDKET